MSDIEPEWIYPHEGEYPCDNRAVAVLIAHRDGTFSTDIGRYYSNGWSLQFWGDNAVVAWTNLPTFKDHTPVVEVDEH